MNMDTDRSGKDISVTETQTTGDPSLLASKARRDALIKIGKFAAYATPAVIAVLAPQDGMATICASCVNPN